MAKQYFESILIVLAGILIPMTPVWGATCPKQPACLASDAQVQVTVYFDKAQPFIDRSHSQRWIQNKSRGRNIGHQQVGLTETHLVHRMTTTFTICSSINSREQCVYPTKVSLAAGYSDTKIYIAHEYPPGSCQYQAIYQHEAEHVRILNRHQERFLPILRADLRHLVRQTRPPSSRNPQRAQKRIMRRLERWMKKKFRRLEKSLDNAHAAIDTRQSYAKIQASCQRW